jgi:ABC-type uncharacterized transport system involved in gliding motility auxiliary subunit
MAMVDPWNEAMAAAPSPTGMPPQDTSSDLPLLFKAWGIEFDPKQVVGDLDGAWRVRASPSDRVQAVDYVAWFNIRDGINHSDPATADLQQVTVASPGFIAKAPGAAIGFSPLLISGLRSGLLPVDAVKMPDPAKILADFKPAGGPRVIAARLRGQLKSAFTGPPPLAKDQTPPANLPAYIAETKTPANLVVVADADILDDRYWVRIQDFFGQSQATPFSDNGAFVANLIDTLAGGDTLIGLRARGTSARPFVLVNDMQADAESQFRQTEQTLQQHLDAVQKQLQTLRQGNAPGAGPGASSAAGQSSDQAAQPVITAEQRSAIDAARQDILTTRQKLRAVQLDLNRGIARLETELRLFDIVLVPAVLTLLAIGLGILRRRRRTRAVPSGARASDAHAPSGAGA